MDMELARYKMGIVASREILSKNVEDFNKDPYIKMMYKIIHFRFNLPHA